MRRFGQLISWLGVVLGGALALSMLLPTHLHGLAWIAAVGAAKLAFASSIGLIAAGAVVQRVALRSAERASLSRGSPPVSLPPPR